MILKPTRYKFFARGNKYKCSLLTRIRVGRSLLNEHSYTLGFSESMKCENCSFHRESPLHFITQCDSYKDLRLIMLDKLKEFIPNIHNLSKKRQFEILLFGYDPENVELTKYNTKIMMATQTFIYDTKRFHSKKVTQPPFPPPAQPHIPPNAPVPAPQT